MNLKITYSPEWCLTKLDEQKILKFRGRLTIFSEGELTVIKQKEENEENVLTVRFKKNTQIKMEDEKEKGDIIYFDDDVSDDDDIPFDIV